MEANIDNVKRTKEICAELLREANSVADDSKAMGAEKRKKDQQDKESKEMADRQAIEKEKEENNRADKQEEEVRMKEAKDAAEKKELMDKVLE
eukprot:4140009-Heterocapsa_arctica.AAC.1